MPPTSRPRRRGERGFTLVELLLVVAALAIGLLAHASSSLAGHRLARSEEGRSVALETARNFVERLRTDEDWAALYATLWSKVDPGQVAPHVGYPLTDYYPDLEVPSSLGTARVRVEGPYAPPPGTPPPGTYVLREDADLPRYGLPYDLNGDGVIDDEARNGDYRALPVVVRFAWQPPGEIGQTLQVTAWLRGER